MMWRQPDDIFGHSAVAVRTVDGTQLFADVMRFPNQLLDNLESFDQLVSDMTIYATSRERNEPRRSAEALFRRVAPEHRPDLEHAYAVLCDLHEQGRDHIWGYFVRNVARPYALALRKVDRLIGNPPWLSYRFMAPDVQEDFRRMSEARGLWAGGRFATHQDLSAFFVARAVERFIKIGGEFGFVMPASALKSIEYSGFRSGDWSAADIEITTVDLAHKPAWRLVDVKPDPFPVPSCVVFGTRTDDGGTQLNTTVDNWMARLPRTRNLSWDVVGPLVERSSHTVRVATGEGGSVYREEFFQGATLTPRRFLLVEEDENQQPEIGAGRDRTFVRSRVSSQDKEPWSNVMPLRAAVEKRFPCTCVPGRDRVSV